MAAMVSTVPQYSRMVDEQGVEMQPELASHMGNSELTPLNLNPLAQQLHQKPAADDAEQGSLCLAVQQTVWTVSVFPSCSNADRCCR